MNRIKTKAYLEVTLEQAREWYESGNEDLKKLALTAFSEEMLIPSFKEIVESEEDYGFWNTLVCLAVEKMIESGLTPQMVVQYKTVDQLAGIAQASAQMFEHIHLGQVTVYGNENTAGNFMAKTAENLNPALDLLRSIPFADTVKEMFGKKQVEATEFEEVK